MKKTKQLLAILIAGAMMFSLSATAFASAPDPTEVEIDGDGSTVFVDTDVYSVILPTSVAWDFTLDPQGLVGAYRGGTIGNANELANATPEQLANYAGRIIPGTAFPVVQNRSSFDVALIVDVKVTGDATVVATSAEVEPADGDAATANNILMNVQLQEEALTGETPLTATFAAASTAVEVPLKETNQSLAFVLAKADYVFSSTNGTDFTFLRTATSFGFGTALQISGLVNKNADWSEFTGADAKEVGIDAKFTLAKATAEQIAVSAVTGAYGYRGVDLTEFEGVGGPTTPEPLGTVVIPTRHASGNADTNIARERADVWNETTPLVIQMPEGVSNVTVGTSVPNLTSNPWAAGTDFTWNSGTRILTITRVPSGNAIVIGDGGSLSRQYTITFTGNP